MCALDVTNVPATSDTYAPVSTGHESGTIHYNKDGKLHKLTGCRGNVSPGLETGNKGMVSFTITGHTANPTDIPLAVPAYDTTEPPAILGAAFTVDGYAGILNALSFDMTNTLSLRPDMNAADGYGEVIITERDVNGTIDPEDVLVATHDFIGNFTSGKSMVLTTGVIGSTAGNRYQIDMPAIYYRDASNGDRDGVDTAELPFGAAESSGDDDFSIIFS